MIPPKARIAEGFGRAAGTYDDHASIQGRGADALGEWLEDLPLPPGPVLEIGCGTGLLSRHLLARFPGRETVLSDLSPGMLESCRRRLEGRHPHLRFETLDGESAPAERCALIASSFAIQWFRDPAASIARWGEALVPGGRILLAFPGRGSFPEWRAACERIGVPYTGLPLPEIGSVLSAPRPRLSLTRREIRAMVQPLDRPVSFFRNLRAIGALQGAAGPGPAALRRLLRVWSPPAATYEVALLDFRRD